MTTAALTLDQDIWRPKYNPWLIAGVVSLAAFMEVLDTSITNVALPYMAGSLGASNDQSTWVLTSYLVSNAIILPMTGWLAGAVGRKRSILSMRACITPSRFRIFQMAGRPNVSSRITSCRRLPMLPRAIPESCCRCFFNLAARLKPSRMPSPAIAMAARAGSSARSSTRS